jgi:hypothetical protein
VRSVGVAALTEANELVGIVHHPSEPVLVSYALNGILTLWRAQQ